MTSESNRLVLEDSISELFSFHLESAKASGLLFWMDDNNVSAFHQAADC